jgi:hypothetical protein
MGDSISTPLVPLNNRKNVKIAHKSVGGIQAVWPELTLIQFHFTSPLYQHKAN